MLLQKIDNLPLKTLSLIIVVIAMMISAQVQYIQHGWINPDSVLYLESAKLLAIGEWEASFNVFPWPLYSLCVAGAHKLSGLSVHHSAQLLSVIFFGITTASFVKIITLAGGKQRQIVAGGLVFFSAQYLVGGVLEMLMRDQGFWAFFLLSLVFFINYYKKNLVVDAFIWQICIIIAVLFRIEAITFLLLLPAILLFDIKSTFRERLISLIKCNFINIALCIGVVVFLILNTDVSTKFLGRLNEVFNADIINQLVHLFIQKSRIMSSQVLGDYLDEFAVPGLVLTLFYVMFLKAISATGLINFVLAGFAIKAKPSLIDNRAYKVLCAVAIIAIVNMALIITKVFVLSGRYVLALSFILMIFAAFYLAYLFKYLDDGLMKPTSNGHKKKWLVMAMLLVMTLGIIKNILPKQNGYNHMQDAVVWVKNDNMNSKPIFYDDTRARYYAQERFIGTWNDNWAKVSSAINDKSILKYDYLIINLSSKDPEKQQWLKEQLMQFDEAKTFYDAKKKKYTLVYKKHVTN